MQLATFTVQLEVGPETRAFIERVAGQLAINVELGPRTREMVEALAQSEADASTGVGPALAGIYRRLRT